MQVQDASDMRDKKREELEAQARVIVDKMKLVTSPTAIKYMEEDLLKVEQHINDLDTRKDEQETQGGVDMPTILTYIKYFVEHLKDLLIDHSNPILRARYFGVLFDKMPSYAEINGGTPENEKVPEVNELFQLVLSGTSSLVRRRGLEPPRS
ncbi:MAG: site-specific recombinase [Patescibacteria group bacterium]|nr:site-specific recombinase [Patescibacteria group bacterium]